MMGERVRLAQESQHPHRSFSNTPTEILFAKLVQGPRGHEETQHATQAGRSAGRSLQSHLGTHGARRWAPIDSRTRGGGIYLMNVTFCKR